MNRFFIKEIANEINSITDIEDINHITKVLRLKSDECVEIVDTKGEEYIMSIKDIQKNKITLKNIEKVNIKREADIKIKLYQGIPKNPKMEYICQKLTEIGVFEIIPVKLKRCVATDINENKISRLQKIIDEASKQSKRNIMPNIKSPITFNQMIDDLKNNDENILFYEDERKLNIKDFVNKIKSVSTIGVIIGPEGGIDEYELEIIKKSNAHILTLGNRILRTETAGLVASSILLYELENKGE